MIPLNLSPIPCHTQVERLSVEASICWQVTALSDRDHSREKRAVGPGRNRATCVPVSVERGSRDLGAGKARLYTTYLRHYTLSCNNRSCLSHLHFLTFALITFFVIDFQRCFLYRVQPWMPLGKYPACHDRKCSSCHKGRRPTTVAAEKEGSSCHSLHGPAEDVCLLQRSNSRRCWTPASRSMSDMHRYKLPFIHSISAIWTCQCCY